ncbi:GntR family transcriptional regulator [Virgibacillus byunsanensis]|uniref:GntR family transcriptional regulator n=1 Tax=Virgibacillus byunsanensis TaxID=570945 RepID=A0ABW3LQ87_9BACI
MNFDKKKYISRISSKDIAYEQLKERIIKCIFDPGQPIVEDELAKELEISRTPLREALLRLELEGLVVRNSNGRIKVAPISIKELKELFIMRSKLEGIVIVDAIDNITEEDVKYLSYLAKMVKLTSRLRNHEDIDNFGAQFHNFIYNISGNKTAVKILFQLNDHINRYRRLAHKHIIDTKKASDEHEIILEYIINKDKVNAESKIVNHIIGSMNQAVKAVEKYESSVTK